MHAGAFELDYGIPSDPFLLFALYSGLAVSLVALMLVGVIAVLRFAIDRENRIKEALTERWQPVFFHAVEGLPFEPPRMRGDEWETVLLIWINFTEVLRGEARQRLRRLAEELRLDRVARQLLRRRGMRLRLMAIVALGRLESAESFEELAALADDPNPMLSLLAVRSLLQITPERALPMLFGQLAGREDWPLGRVAAMLEELPADILSRPLLAALEEAPPGNAPRLISLLNVAHIGDTWPFLAPFLSAGQPPEVLVAALKACHDPQGLEAARALAIHDQWIVRAQAAVVLGRIGVEEDRFRLQALLSDPEWWVRYRAATALAGFPGMSRAKLADLCGLLSDPFAADILTQVLAEKNPEAPR